MCAPQWLTDLRKCSSFQKLLYTLPQSLNMPGSMYEGFKSHFGFSRSVLTPLHWSLVQRKSCHRVRWHDLG